MMKGLNRMIPLLVLLKIVCGNGQIGNDSFDVLKQIPIPPLQEDVEDVVMWMTNENKLVNFYTGQVWRDFNNSIHKVPWKQLMWFSQSCPKHSFVMWIVVQGRLATQDRLSKWNPNGKFICSLCEKCADSHDHLFFSCDFSKKVCYHLIQKTNSVLPDMWSSIVSSMIGFGFKNSIDNITRRLMIGACVYMIWKERNARLFQNKKQTMEIVIQQIEESIRTSLLSLTVKEYVAVRKMVATLNECLGMVSILAGICQKKSYCCKPLQYYWMVVIQLIVDPASGALNMDTGTSSHLNDSITSLSDVFNTSIYPSVSVGDGHTIPVTNTGHSILPTPHRPLHLNNVLITPHIVKNFIFVHDNNCTIEFDAFGFFVKDFMTRRVLLRCDSMGDLYLVTQPSLIPHAFLTSQHTWHQRLGHPRSKVLRRLVSRNLNSCNKEKPPFLCHACQLGKHVRLPFVSSNTSVTSRFNIVTQMCGLHPFRVF
ncbi:ribonuclease H-like domain-containing protein [Tanacetum coccineum]|uniref:Ribonuclease H-like domain-containing protein n=1 Tax=Tanacetum coccineum TaxID=301880 RepID=A0ABQ4YE66_9ASTR